MDFADRANRIPTGAPAGDAECLKELMLKSNSYLDFVLSRFNLLRSKQEIYPVIMTIIERLDACTPFLEFMISNQDIPPLTTNLIDLLGSEKAEITCVTLMISKRFTQIAPSVLYLLFSTIPTGEMIRIRDSILCKYVQCTHSPEIPRECLMRIPVTLSIEFCIEFESLFAYLIGVFDNDEQIVNTGIEAAIKCDDNYTIVNLLKNQTVPSEFKDWVKAEEMKTRGSTELPPFLRLKSITPPLDKLPIGRFCRLVPQTGEGRKMIEERIMKEKDPRNLHDLLIAYATPVNISSPLKYIVASKAALRDKKFKNRFLSLYENIPRESESVAFESLLSVAQRYMDIPVDMLKYLRNKFTTVHLEAVADTICKIVAIGVGSGRLDDELIWRDFHSILTVSKFNLEYEDLIHYAVISLSSKELASTAVSIIVQAAKEDLNSVRTALQRVPRKLIEPWDTLHRFVPVTERSQSIKYDDLPDILKSTSNTLLIASALVMFHDSLAGKYTDEWSMVLMNTGKCLFNRESNTRQMLRRMKSANEMTRFAAAFSIAVMIAHQIESWRTLNNELLELIKCESSPIVRMMLLYALSYGKIKNCSEFCTNYLSKEGITQEDIIGISYCVNSWFIDCTVEGTGYIGSVVKYNKEFIGEKTDIEYNKEYYAFLTKDYSGFEEQAITQDLLSVLLFGPIPFLAFRVNRFEPTEEQWKLIKRCEDADIILQFINHSVMVHQGFNVQERRTVTDIVKNSWKTLSEEELGRYLRMISNAEKEQIYNMRNELSIILAMNEGNIRKIAELLPSDESIMRRVIDAMPKSTPDIVTELVATANMKKLVEFMTLSKYGEVISNTALIPPLLAEYKPSETLISYLREQKPSYLKEYALCLLYTYPDYFKSHEDTFNLIN